MRGIFKVKSFDSFLLFVFCSFCYRLPWATGLPSSRNAWDAVFTPRTISREPDSKYAAWVIILIWVHNSECCVGLILSLMSWRLRGKVSSSDCLIPNAVVSWFANKPDLQCQILFLHHVNGPVPVQQWEEKKNSYQMFARWMCTVAAIQLCIATKEWFFIYFLICDFCSCPHMYT